MYTLERVCTHKCERASAHAHTCTCTHVRTHTYTRMQASAYTHAHAHTYTHMRICTCMRAHTHTRAVSNKVDTYCFLHFLVISPLFSRCIFYPHSHIVFLPFYSLTFLTWVTTEHTHHNKEQKYFHFYLIDFQHFEKNFLDFEKKHLTFFFNRCSIAPLKHK